MRVLSPRHLAYWLKPSRWPEATRRLRQGRAGVAWCAKRAVSTSEALAHLGVEESGPGFLERFADPIEEAQRRIAECPYRMGGGGNLDLLYALVRGTDARRVVETGVAYGWSSLAILLAIEGRADAILCSTDLAYAHLGRANEEWVGVAVPETLRAPWTFFRGSDRDVLPEAVATATPLDIAHYDSDTSVPGRLWAYGKLWEALRPGGLLISDDVHDNLAFRDFCAAVGAEPVIVRNAGKYQGVVRRPRSL